MSGSLQTIAILVSRVEALVLASVLESEGIPVHVTGSLHASVDPISLALGGHRLMVPIDDFEAASEILFEVGAQDWVFSRGLQRAVLRFLTLWIGFCTFLGGLLVAGGMIPAVHLLQAPLTAIGIPVNPQGRGDFFLARRRGGDSD